MEVTRAYRASRDQLLGLRGDHARAVAEFAGPDLGNRFDWAVDWFDAVARGNDRPALVLVEEDGSSVERGFAEMSRASARLAAWLEEALAADAETASREWRDDDLPEVRT